MGKGDGQRPRFVPYEEYAARYDRIFGEQQAPASAGPDGPAPWDDAAIDEAMPCLDCLQETCTCDWQRIEDEYRE